MEILKKSILAGIYISLAGIAFLKVGGVLGAILFGFGLLGVIQTGSLLYTGRIYYEESLKTLALVLLGNVIGCFVIGSFAGNALQLSAAEIMNARVEDNLFYVFGKGVFCGIIMTTAVMGAKEKNWWPLLLGIPFFILSGFYHSIADAFYFFVSPTWRYLYVWVLVVLGNYVGGKLLWIKKLEDGSIKK